jgi:hypothetical protein
VVPQPPILWAPKVSQQAIRRLYETEARGIVDEDQIDGVGIALFARCESILKVTEAHRGRIACGACDNVILFEHGEHWAERNRPFSCANCGWSTTWAAYLATYQKKQLHSGSAERVFADFVRSYPLARTPKQRMIAIDSLLHDFHVHYQLGDTRPAAANVVEGSTRDILRLLDELAGADRAAEWRARARGSVFGRHLAPKDASASHEPSV